LILYDGVCGLCHRVTRFVLPRDTRKVFRFASIQSDVGRRMLQAHGKDPDALDTFCVVSDYKSEHSTLFMKASGVLFVVRRLGWPWRLATVFGVLPRRILNWGYDRVAKNRYRFFGRYEVCMLPSPDDRDRFLDA
jgi:predicted DCC family thiol-disulfide oxidoreductase YuxK